MLGKKFHVGYLWLTLSLGLIIVSLSFYYRYLTVYGFSNVNGLDVFALAIMSVGASYFISSISDDIGYVLAQNSVKLYKVTDKKNSFYTFAGRGSSKVSYEYRVTFFDESKNKKVPLFCSSSHYEALNVGDKVTCTRKGNVLLDIDFKMNYQFENWK